MRGSLLMLAMLIGCDGMEPLQTSSGDPEIQEFWGNNRSLRRRVNTLEDQLDDARSDVAALQQTLAAVTERLEDIEAGDDGIDGLRAEVAVQAESLAALRDDFNDNFGILEITRGRLVAVETNASANSADLALLKSDDPGDNFGWLEITRGRIAEVEDNTSTNAAAIDDVRDDVGINFGFLEITRGRLVEVETHANANAADLELLKSDDPGDNFGFLEITRGRIAEVEDNTNANAAAIDDVREDVGTNFGFLEITRGRLVEVEDNTNANAAAIDDVRDDVGTNFGFLEITRGRLVEVEDNNNVQADTIAALDSRMTQAEDTVFDHGDALQVDTEIALIEESVNAIAADVEVWTVQAGNAPGTLDADVLNNRIGETFTATDRVGAVRSGMGRSRRDAGSSEQEAVEVAMDTLSEDLNRLIELLLQFQEIEAAAASLPVEERDAFKGELQALGGDVGDAVGAVQASAKNGRRRSRKYKEKSGTVTMNIYVSNGGDD